MANFRLPMQAITDLLRPFVFSIATPHSAGSGFYLSDAGLLVTNEHLVRDDREVIVAAPDVPEQLATVVYLDPFYDLAFLQLSVPPDFPRLSLSPAPLPTDGQAVLALGHPFGFPFNATAGTIKGNRLRPNGIALLELDNCLEPGHSGGPLLHPDGRLIGVNTVLLDATGNSCLSLPASYLFDSLEAFAATAGEAVRCAYCATVCAYHEPAPRKCPSCKKALPRFPRQLAAFEPSGIAASVEEILTLAGYHPPLARRGPDHWAVRQGSALIELAYYEKNGFLTGDAILCRTDPDRPQEELLAFLLKENYRLDNLRFSLREQQIVLSFMIYDRYLHTDTGQALFRQLFERADHYDDILVDRFGARWVEN